MDSIYHPKLRQGETARAVLVLEAIYMLDDNVLDHIIVHTHNIIFLVPKNEFRDR
jgi:hypothetical protein